VLGRWSSVPQALALPHARPDGSGALLRAGPGATAFATLCALAACAIAAGAEAGAVAFGVAVGVTALGELVALRAFGGVTGDTFGAVSKLVELAAYASLTAAW
jgi:adenosylcobinamide-GDP ribazoletransferase